MGHSAFSSLSHLRIASALNAWLHGRILMSSPSLKSSCHIPHVPFILSSSTMALVNFLSTISRHASSVITFFTGHRSYNERPKMDAAADSKSYKPSSAPPPPPAAAPFMGMGMGMGTRDIRFPYM